MSVRGIRGAVIAVAIGLVVACGHGAGPASPHSEAARAPLGAPAAPPQYIVADPSHEDSVVAVPLGAGGALGLVVDRTRIVVGRGEPRLGDGLPQETIAGAAAIPQRLGGGFLFWTESSLYRSASFEGVLEPIAKMPDPIATISFAPKFLLVRSRNGERWALGLPKGERVALEPLGVVDVEGLDDGRALAFNDQGAALSSTDGGAHWVDVTTQLKNAPVRVAVVDEEIWFFESNDTATRLEPDGQLSFFDKPPVEKTQILRAPDPRWRGQEAPLRTVFRAGASIDESTALVIEQGDLVRIDVHTGELVGVVSGKLPPDSSCEAVPTPNDVLFACSTHGPNGAPTGAFVVSHTLSNDTPVVEQTFGGVGQFWSSDDGGLVFQGPCSGGAPAATTNGVVCVRQPGGSWQDLDLTTLSGDAGPSDVNVQRWIPRGDGRAVAVILDPELSMFDPRTGTLVAIEPAAREAFALPAYAVSPRRRRPAMPYRYGLLGRTTVDSTWSFSGTGSLRGWAPSGAAVEIEADGKVTRSPYTFEIASSGPNGLGRTDDGRYYQSSDHGVSWSEVAAPPSGAAAGDLRACSSAGCDLGGFYRVGWATRPPRVDPPATPAKLAPEVRRTRPVEMSCRASGPAVAKVLPRTENSPEDLGMGMARLPIASEHTELGYVRVPISRGIVFPIRDGGIDTDSTALRALLSGYGTSADNGTIEVTGPNKNASSLRRTVSFLPPFDPLATLKKGQIAMSEVIAAGRLAGMTNDEILQDDMTESGSLTAMTPHDPLAASDLVFHNPRGLIAFVHASERVKVAVRASADDAMIVSGVSLGGDDAAFLELESTGAGHVFRMSASGTTDLFDVNPNASDASLYPANPDALAVGPKGEVALIRIGSGGDPASVQDPALLIVQQSPTVALAPWSTLRLSDDPACKEPGWRTTLQLIAPWIRMTNPELHVTGPGPMFARVKWNDKRVCLEGLELRLPDVSVRVTSTSGSELIKPTSFLVSRGSQFARIAITEGIEWRQPMDCTLKN